MHGKRNRVHAINDGSTPLVEYKYLGGGRAVVADYTEPDIKLDLWGGTVGSYDGLDRFGRVIDQRWVDYAGSPVDVARLEYGYDRDSLPNFRRDVVAHSAGKGFDELYTRDGLNRLNNYQRGLLNSGNTAIDTLDFEQDWSLDQVANWTAFDEDDDGDGTDDLVQTRTHNKVNEITDITNTTGSAWIEPAYDDAGNTTTLPKPETPTAGFTAKYDAWNRLVALSEESGGTKVAEYAYDARNFRIIKKLYDGSGTLENTFDYYYTAGWQCIEEVEVPETGTGRTSQYVWGLRYIDDLVCRDYTPSGGSTTRHYALSDRRFNVVAIVDTSGNVDERYSYTPYGTVTFLSSSWVVQSSSSHDWVYLFQGLRRDVESGLVENRMRMNNPVIGRFLQRDPLGYLDGMNAYAAYHIVYEQFDPAGTHCGLNQQEYDEVQELNELIDSLTMQWHVADQAAMLSERDGHTPTFNSMTELAEGIAQRRAELIGRRDHLINVGKYPKYRKATTGFVVIGRGVNSEGRSEQAAAASFGGHTDIYYNGEEIRVGFGGITTGPITPDRANDALSITTVEVVRNNNWELEYGRYKGTCCKDVTDEMIVDCIVNKPQQPDTEYNRYTNNCQHDVVDALGDCCLRGFSTLVARSRDFIDAQLSPYQFQGYE